MQKVLKGDTSLITQNIRSYWLDLCLCQGQICNGRSHRAYWPSFSFSKGFQSIIASGEWPPCVLDLPGLMWPWLSNRGEREISYLCYRNMALCVPDSPAVKVHYNLYTRGRGDASSSAQIYGPRSNWMYSLVFTHSNVFF